MQLANYQGVPSHIVTPLDAIRRRFPEAVIDYAPGSTYTPDSSALIPAGAGLKAEYFDNADLTGEPRLTRTEPRINFNWDTRDPAVVAAVPRQEFSVRWTGTLIAPYAGLYQMKLFPADCHDCDGSADARLYLDENRVNEPRALEAGSAHALRVEYRQRGGGTGTELVWIPPAAPMLEEAGRAMRSADVTLLFLGLTANIEGEDLDRESIQLPEPQQKLLDLALSSARPVVVVLMTGGAIVAAGAHQLAAAILEAWYPGQDGGTAIAETLAGDNNPSGRLPVTFYQSDAQLPPFDEYSMAGRTYRFLAGEPLYPFGYGLSYSTFRYSGISFGPAGRIKVDVTNTSQRDGDEVVQLYLESGHDPYPSLKAFERIHVPADETRTVEFKLSKVDWGRARAVIADGRGVAIPATGRMRRRATVP